MNAQVGRRCINLNYLFQSKLEGRKIFALATTTGGRNWIHYRVSYFNDIHTPVDAKIKVAVCILLSSQESSNDWYLFNKFRLF